MVGVSFFLCFNFEHLSLHWKVQEWFGPALGAGGGEGVLVKYCVYQSKKCVQV